MDSKSVVVAMSGGVDSSVAALLLKDKGFKVIGITMQIRERSGDWGGCCGLESIHDAKRVADKLKIPHYVLNFRKIFRQRVILDFCEEYKAGRTPNPCIRCNQHIKFDALLRKAKQMNADYIATGHYARIEKINPKAKGRAQYILKRGIDPKKDQSYVLYAMTQGQLSYTLMPLGGYTKAQIRKIAHERDLPVADKPESQEICFIPDNNYGKFLEEYMPKEVKPGAIIDKHGRVIGEHPGVIFYTIGQRKRIGIAASEPLYVIKIDKKKNTIMVGGKDEVLSRELIADNINFINRKKLKTPIRIEAKVRYLHDLSPATVVSLNRNKLKLRFDKPQWAITPGQAVVFYNQDVVLGGGTILSGENSKYN
ncbi:MAG: tRNA 2-thiouridine(34) synthase MnmA [Candidatus Omnitrophota bacterium]